MKKRLIGIARAQPKGELWRYDPKAETITIPGLRDLHTHPFIYSMMEAARTIDISKCETADQVKKALEGGKGHGVIVADGLKIKITAKELDSISSEDHVIVIDPSYHGGVVNSKTARTLKEKAKGKNVKGDLLSSGKWNEEYLKLCLQVIAETLDKGELVGRVVDWVHRQKANGIVEIHDLDSEGVLGLEVLTAARERWGPDFPVTRVFASPDAIAHIPKKLATKLDSYFGGVGAKIYADGSIGSFTAGVELQYYGTRNRGKLLCNARELEGIIRNIRLMDGLVPVIAIHAIGDRGIKFALDMASKLNQAVGKQSWIQHYELSGIERILLLTKRLFEDGSVAGVVTNPNFVSDVTVYAQRLGNRVEWINPHASILELGIPLRFGTDGMPQDMVQAVCDAAEHPVERHRISLDDALKVAGQVDSLKNKITL